MLNRPLAGAAGRPQSRAITLLVKTSASPNSVFPARSGVTGDSSACSPQPLWKKRHQTAKTPLGSGANTPAEVAGKTLNLAILSFPPTQALRQAKTLFSLIGKLCADFRLLRGVR
jgi:hypothetical protein